MIGGLVLLPVVLFAVGTGWGALVLVGLLVLGGIGVWIQRKGLVFAEIAAFLIHFDGVGQGPVRMGRVVALIGALVLVYKLLSGWRPPAIPPKHWIPVWALLAWAVFTGAWSASASAWFLNLCVFGLGVAYFCISGMLLDTPAMVQRYLRAFWVGGLFGSAAGILALFLGTRSVGFGGDPNFFGLLQASMIPLTVYFRRQATDARTKWLYTLALLFVLAGAAGAGSRSGLIGGSIAIVATMITRPGLNPVRRVGVSIGAMVMGALAFLVGFVANPANLQRGFSDRGAGRLDLWNVTIELIKQRPFTGYGFGQIKTYIVPNLLTTPGSKWLMDTRTEVSAHNTWLDVTGDLGLIGLAIFVSVFIITLWSLLTPRWKEDRELSTILFVMMLPVLSGSFFLPLLNNKLSWSLIGVAAALQVPSWGARWTGLAGSARSTELVPTTTGPPGRRLPERDGGRAAGGPLDAAPVAGFPAPPQVRLARWDLRVSRRFRIWILVGALIGGLVLGVVASAMPTEYEAVAGVFVPELDGPEGRETIAVDRERLQGVLTTAISAAYAAQLQQLSGVDLSVPEVRSRLSVTRPEMGAYLEVTYTDTDRANAEAVLPQLLPAMDALYSTTQDLARAQTANELRPVVPGEQRFYGGDYFLRIGRAAEVEPVPPRTVWLIFVGMSTGALIAAGLALAQQRRPRVNNDDDFDEVLGIPLWAHIGRTRRRRTVSSGQFAQISAMAVEHCDHLDGDAGPSRFVVTSPRRDASAGSLALGLSVELVAEGRRVVLVDAQLDRPELSARLGRFGRKGLADVVVSSTDISTVVRRIHPWLLPRRLRRAIAGGSGELRFVSAGRRRAAKDATVPLGVLDRFDPDVTVVMVAPPILGDIPMSAVLSWGDAVVLTLVEGRTVTFDAEDAAAVVRTFSFGCNGAVLLDV